MHTLPPGRTCRSLLAAYGALVPLAFVPLLMDDFNLPKSMLTLCCAAAALGCLLTSALLGSDSLNDAWKRALSWRLRSLIEAGFLAVAFSALVSTVFSISPRVSWFGELKSHEGALVILSGVVLFFATRAFCTTAIETSHVASATAVAMSAAAAYAVAQASRLDPLQWQTLDASLRPASTMGHPNSLAGMAAASLPLAFWFAATASRRTAGRCVAAVMAVLLVAAIAVAQSRAGYLALGAALATLAVHIGATWRRVGLMFGGTTIVIAGTVFAAFAFDLPILSEFSSTLRRVSRFEDATGRVEIWKGAWSIFLSSPLTGSGVDSFRLAFPPVQSPAYWHKEWGQHPHQAHSELLQVLAMQGILGAAAMGMVFAGICLAYRRAAKTERVAAGAIAASLAALTAFFLFGRTNAAMSGLFACLCGMLSRLASRTTAETEDRMPSSEGAWHLACAGGLSIMLAFWICDAYEMTCPPWGAGILVALFGTAAWSRIPNETRTQQIPAEAPSSSPEPESSRLGALLGVGTIWTLVLAVPMLVAYPAIRASQACRAGLDALATQPQVALQQFELACALEPWNDHYQCLAGETEGILAQIAASPQDRRQLRGFALQKLTQAIEMAPRRGANRRASANLLTQWDDESKIQQAFQSFDVAISLEPANPHFYAEAYRAALRLSKDSIANRYRDACTAMYGGLPQCQALFESPIKKK